MSSFSWADKARKATPQATPEPDALFLREGGNPPMAYDDAGFPISMLPEPSIDTAAYTSNDGIFGPGEEDGGGARQQQQRSVVIDEKAHIVAPGTGYARSTVKRISGDIWATKILVFCEYVDVLRVGFGCHVLYDAARRESLWASIEESYLNFYCIMTGREEPPAPTFLIPPQSSSLMKKCLGGGGAIRGGRSSHSGRSSTSSTPQQSNSAHNTPKVGPNNSPAQASLPGASGKPGGKPVSGYVIRGSDSPEPESGVAARGGSARESGEPSSASTPVVGSSPPIAPRGCSVSRALARDSRIISFIRLNRFLAGDMQRQWHLQNLAKESWLFQRVAAVVSAARKFSAGRGNAQLRARGYVPVEFEPFLPDIVVAEVADDSSSSNNVTPVTRPPVHYPSRRDAATVRRQEAEVRRRLDEAAQMEADRREEAELSALNSGRNANNAPLFYTTETVSEQGANDHDDSAATNNTTQAVDVDENGAQPAVDDEDGGTQHPLHPTTGGGMPATPVRMYTILRPDDTKPVNPASLQSLLESIRNNVPSRLEHIETTEANPVMYMSTLAQVLRRLHGGGFSVFGVRGSLAGPRFTTGAHLIEITQDEAVLLVHDTFLNLENSVSTYQLTRAQQRAEAEGGRPAARATGAGGGGVRQRAVENNYDDPNSLITMARMLVSKELTVDAAETRYFASVELVSAHRGMGLVVVDPMLVSVFYP